VPNEQWSRDNALRVLDAVADAIVTIDTHGKVFYSNDAVESMFGYNRAELLGRPVDLLMPPGQADEHQGKIHQYVQSGEAHIIGRPREVVAQKKNGDRFHVLLTVNEMQTDAGLHFAGVMHDLTATHEQQSSLHAQREQLARAGRLATVGEMTASVAHEMNQPLTAIAMYAQACQRLLTHDEVNVEKLSTALNKLSEQALRAGAVNEQVQHFVRNEKEDRQVLDVNELLHDVRPLAASDARAHGIELVLQLAESLPVAYCSGINVQQVALSLLRNAFDAMAEIDCCHGSVVTLTTALTSERGQEYIRISVLDEGPGIDPLLVPGLFDPFVTSKKRGMGLGLSSCRSLITEEGGQLDFENGSPVGAHFFFTLPVARPE